MYLHTDDEYTVPMCFLSYYLFVNMKNKIVTKIIVTLSLLFKLLSIYFKVHFSYLMFM